MPCFVLFCELQAGDGARDYVFLDLDQVGIRDRHSKNCVETRVAWNADDHAGPIALVNSSAEVALDSGEAGNRNVFFIERAEILHDFLKAPLSGVHIIRHGF